MEKDKTSTVPALSAAIMAICLFVRTFAQSNEPVVVAPLQPCVVPMLHLNYQSNSGDSIEFTTGIPHTMPGTGQDLDTLIKWILVKPSFDQNVVSLRTESGPTNMFYSANVPGTASTYRIFVSFLNPCSGMLETDSLKLSILISPKPNYLYIETDTNIDPKVTTPAMVNRLRNPAPIGRIALQAKDRLTIAAIVRDAYGNFIGFCKTAKWQVIGDSGIVSLSIQDKPYLCNVGAEGDGAVLIRLSDDSASHPDSLRVNVQSSHGDKIVWGATRPMDSKPASKELVREHYNVRGQKLSLYGTRHALGIVLEQVIGPSGTPRENKLAVPKKQ